MEFVSKQATHKTRSAWSSVAFIVESIVLLLFLVASLAVLTRVFTSALSNSVESRTQDAAVIAASSIAEHFAANPADVAEQTSLGDLVIRCNVVDEPRAGGIMHVAHIDVYDIAGDAGTPVYSIVTSSYESEVAR